MTVYRNVGTVPLDGFADGVQVFPQQDYEPTDKELRSPHVKNHLEQGTFVVVGGQEESETPEPEPTEESEPVAETLPAPTSKSRSK